MVASTTRRDSVTLAEYRQLKKLGYTDEQIRADLDVIPGQETSAPGGARTHCDNSSAMGAATETSTSVVICAERPTRTAKGSSTLHFA